MRTTPQKNKNQKEIEKIRNCGRGRVRDIVTLGGKAYEKEWFFHGMLSAAGIFMRFKRLLQRSSAAARRVCPGMGGKMDAAAGDPGF